MNTKLTGRPPRKKGENKTYRIIVRLNTSEYYSFLSKLKMSNMNKSDFIRESLNRLEVKERLTVEHLNLIRKLTGMANNLNQLAHQANAMGYLIVQHEVKSLSKKIDDVIYDIRS